MTEQTASRISDDKVLAIPPKVVASHHGGLVPETPDQMMRIAATLFNSKLIPKSFDSVDKAFCALMYCYEQGIAPFSSMQWLMVQNGRVAEWGDLPISRVLAARDTETGKRICTWIRDDDEALKGLGPNGEVTDETVATITSQRLGWPEPMSHSFSVADAKEAGLWGGANLDEEWKRKLCPWVKYPKTMLIWRAKQRHLRSCYADVLHGIVIAEDVPPTGPPAAQTFDPDKAQGAEHDALPEGRVPFGFHEDAEHAAAAIKDAESSEQTESEPKTEPGAKGDNDGTALFAPKDEAPPVRRSRARLAAKATLLGGSEVTARWADNICKKIKEALPDLGPDLVTAVGENWLATLGPQPDGLTWDELENTDFQAEVKRTLNDVPWEKFR